MKRCATLGSSSTTGVTVNLGQRVSADDHGAKPA